jgi:WhiB family transcriptional regulator, redox-sensing transcriptional regulator
MMSSEWMAKGSCNALSPEMFFPTDSVGVIAAQRVCAGCDVRAQCLDYALSNHLTHGVWGGTSERQRFRLQRARAAAPSAGTS